MENIKEFAELISAIAALITVFLASIELYSRSNVKKAEDAADVYSKFLIIEMQLNYAIESISNLTQRYKNFSSDELSSYAKSQLLDSTVPLMAQKIENCFIKNTNPKKESNKIKSQLVLDFTGKVTNLVKTINTFYSVIATKEMPSEDWIEQHGKEVVSEFKKMKDLIKNTQSLLNENLNKTHSFSKAYIISLPILAVVFLFICFIL